MDAKQFLAEFGHIANAPGGVARLRELVLQLAISGGLSERVSQDTPVIDSLALATTQRAGYESNLKLRPTRLQPPPTPPFPFLVPHHWEWVRLEQLALYIQRGKGPKYADRGVVSVVSQKCIQWPGFDASQARRIADESIGSYGKERFLCQGDLLWNSTGTGTAGRVAIFSDRFGEEVVADSHVTVIRLANALPKYIWCVIASPWVQARIQPAHPNSLVSGTTQQVELSTSTARALAIPCPPLEEQGRIVAKVDELMILCGQLEAQQQNRRKAQNLLRHSVLEALASAQSPHELQVSWMRASSTLHQLFDTPEDVRALRTSILELAVQGLLTKQIDSDVSAEQQLAKIRELSSQFVETGRRRKAVTYRSVENDELGYSLPKGWTYARLGELVRILNGRAYSKSELLDSGTPVLRVGNLFTSKDWYFSNLELDDDKYCDKGDLIYAWSASFGPFIWTGPKVIFHYHIWKLDLFSEADLSKDFLYLVLQERTAAIKSAGHGISMAHMTKEKMEQLPIAVPPLREQQRIVSSVAALMGACDELERRLLESKKVAGRLAHASIFALTGISIERGEEALMKAPQTELIAHLRLGIPPDVKDQAPLATLLARHNGEMSARALWQRFGGEIDAFYSQLKSEVAHGWIAEPATAEVRETTTAEAEA